MTALASIVLPLILAVAMWPTLVPLVVLLGVVVAGEWVAKVGRRAGGGR